MKAGFLRSDTPGGVWRAPGDWEFWAVRLSLSLLLFGVLALSAACSASAQTASSFYCPMHPQVTSPKPGDCQICGMHLVARKSGDEPPGARRAEKTSYACPMHPEIRSDRPADCSVCGMHLEKRVVVEGTEAASASPPGLAPVALDESRRRALGLTFGRVEVREFGPTIRAAATILPDETRVYRIIARVDGYIDRLDVNYAGQRVATGRRLLSIYSPSIQAVQQQFVGQTPSSGRRVPADSARAADAPDAEDRDDVFRAKLKYWGFGDEQIDRIQQARKVESSLEVVAPASGVVTDKSAVLGQRVAPGDPLFTVMDLSRVWAEVSVSERDAPSIREGMPVALTVNSLPGTNFSGRVKFFHPVLDPQTHTMRVVVEIPNPRLDLKPGMLGTARAEAAVGRRLSVPEGAVLRAGQEDYTFVEEGERLIPRKVVLGAAGGGYWEVVSGLADGERVATSATFLLDSESSLQAALLAVGGPK